MRKDSILFIVEGEADSIFLSSLTSRFQISCEMSIVGFNIHKLYVLLKEDNGFLDIVSVLRESYQKTLNLFDRQGKTRKKEIEKIQEYLNILEKKQFSSIYLFFDCEIHHTTVCEKRNELTDQNIISIVKRNSAELNEMLDFFCDETNLKRGKLYLNYPMLESYKDCKSFFDEEYQKRFVCFGLLFKKNDKYSTYKDYVRKNGLRYNNARNFTAENFKQLIKMNIFKLNSISSHCWRGIDYNSFRELSEQKEIFRNEQIIFQNGFVATLNTSLFFVIDYKGKVLFDEVIQA